jgi:hypothetical protein
VTSALRASLGPSLGSAGHVHVALLLTNTSGVRCALTGYPGLSFTAGADAHQLGSPAGRDPRYPVLRVALAPGATAHATATVTDYGVYDPTACLPARAAGFRLFPPGSTRSLLISDSQTACSRPGVQGFEVTVIRSGVSPS